MPVINKKKRTCDLIECMWGGKVINYASIEIIRILKGIPNKRHFKMKYSKLNGETFRINLR